MAVAILCCTSSAVRVTSFLSCQTQHMPRPHPGLKGTFSSRTRSNPPSCYWRNLSSRYWIWAFVYCALQERLKRGHWAFCNLCCWPVCFQSCVYHRRLELKKQCSYIIEGQEPFSSKSHTGIHLSYCALQVRLLCAVSVYSSSSCLDFICVCERSLLCQGLNFALNGGFVHTLSVHTPQSKIRLEKTSAQYFFLDFSLLDSLT